jgi:hypothetical protein
MPGNAALFAVVCAIALHRPPAPLPEQDGPVRAGAAPGRPLRRLRLVASRADEPSRASGPISAEG